MINREKHLGRVSRPEFLLNLNPNLERSSVRSVLTVVSIRLESSILPHSLVVRDVPFRESKLLGDNDLLSSRELEFCSSQSFNHILLMSFLGSDRDHNLINVDSSNCSKRLSIGSSHSSLKSISSCTR